MISRAANLQTTATGEEYVRELLKLAMTRVQRGLAPPPELYRVRDRSLIDWSVFPEWARPIDPEVFEGCSHEG